MYLVKFKQNNEKQTEDSQKVQSYETSKSNRQGNYFLKNFISILRIVS